MLKLSRFLFGAFVALGGLASVNAEPAPTPAGESLPPELQAELDKLLRTWQPSAAARTSLGWRDNVLLSPFDPIERGFARGELEAMLLRPMQNRWEFISFLNGDVLRYFSPPPEAGGEQQWSLHTEGRWQPVKPARLALKAAGYLRDMVIDLSETEALRVVAPTRVRGGYATAATRVTLGQFQVEPSVQVKRTDYRDYSGDYDEVRSGGRVEWRRSDALAISAGWFESHRGYDERTQFSASGRPLSGSRLRFRQKDGELKVRTGWAGGGEWKVTAYIGRLENRDRASGYFDYDQKRGRLDVDWTHASWRINLNADARRMDYLLQTVGAGLTPPPRISDDHEITLRTERELNSSWMIFGEHRWERSRSNEIEFRFKANTVLAGVQRSF
jgi:hypothetical protein